MKRKKWSELEEQTLLIKYADLLNSGTLAKLKTREKKFKPIADHVNSVHHLQDPINFPFKWSWRDVSIKVQNMRHQYLGVKQKIRAPDGDFTWTDGENHWENFLKYKEVFGDVELIESNASGKERSDLLGDSQDGDNENGILGLRFEIYGEGDAELGGDCLIGDSEYGELGNESGERDEIEGFSVKRLKRGGARKLGLINAQALELRDVVMRREERRREREWSREEANLEREERKIDRELCKEINQEEREEKADIRELELEERQMLWARREFDKRLRLEREFDEERKRRKKLEERLEEEEMKWRERMVSIQIEHEKQMMQMNADACQNQLQVLGVLTRFVCQFFGSVNDGLGGGLGTLPHQVLQNMQHPDGLGDNEKQDANLPSEFL